MCDNGHEFVWHLNYSEGSPVIALYWIVSISTHQACQKETLSPAKIFDIFRYPSSPTAVGEHMLNDYGKCLGTEKCDATEELFS